MAEPENHTPRLLREIRGAIGTLDTKVDSLDTRIDSLDKKADRNHEELKRRLGESVLGRYAAGEVEERFSAIESRLSALEQQR